MSITNSSTWTLSINIFGGQSIESLPIFFCLIFKLFDKTAQTLHLARGQLCISFNHSILPLIFDLAHFLPCPFLLNSPFKLIKRFKMVSSKSASKMLMSLASRWQHWKKSEFRTFKTSENFSTKSRRGNAQHRWISNFETQAFWNSRTIKSAWISIETVQNRSRRQSTSG